MRTAAVLAAVSVVTGLWMAGGPRERLAGIGIRLYYLGGILAFWLVIVWLFN